MKGKPVSIFLIFLKTLVNHLLYLLLLAVTTDPPRQILREQAEYLT